MTHNRKVPMQAFAGMLGGQLMEMAERMEREEASQSEDEDIINSSDGDD